MPQPKYMTTRVNLQGRVNSKAAAIWWSKLIENNLKTARDIHMKTIGYLKFTIEFTWGGNYLSSKVLLHFSSKTFFKDYDFLWVFNVGLVKSTIRRFHYCTEHNAFLQLSPLLRHIRNLPEMIDNWNFPELVLSNERFV